MTETSTGDPFFDVRRSVRTRNLTRLVIAPVFSAGMIWLGARLIPKDTVLSLDVEAIETWSVWSFFGCIIVGCGDFGLAKELVFAIRARSTTGEWHFRLTEKDLLWHVPRHAHGKEEGFAASLDEIKLIESKIIENVDGLDEREYWIHFHAREPIQLRPFSGVSLPQLVDKIRAAGIPFNETREGY